MLYYITADVCHAGKKKCFYWLVISTKMLIFSYENQEAQEILQTTEGKQLLVLKNVLSAREMPKDPDKHSDDFIPKNT